MPKNVEIKAKVQDFVGLIKKAKNLSNEEGKTLQQRDVFYNCKNGRLKLRSVTTQENEKHSQLIFYQRPDESGPKLSDYAIAAVSEGNDMGRVLSAALGSTGTVRKQRTLFLVGQTRIHVDKVEGLGHFMELEVVMRDDQTPQEGAIIAESLMEQLGVDKSDLITGAYHDLLMKKHNNQ